MVWARLEHQALRRSAFQEAIAHLGRAIEMADRPSTRRRGVRQARSAASNLTTDAVAASPAQKAATWAARGVGAAGIRRKPLPEPTNRLIATRTRPKSIAVADFGLWASSYMARRACRRCGRTAAAFLSDRRGETRSVRGQRRPSRRRDHLLVRRRISRGAGSPGKGACPVRTRPRRRSLAHPASGWDPGVAAVFYLANLRLAATWLSARSIARSHLIA